MGKIQIVCPNCQAKYKVTLQGDVQEKISFACRKCAHLIELDPAAPKPSPEPTTELTRVVCKNCHNEFVKNIEDNSELCYQCRIDVLLKKKRESEQKPAEPAPEARPAAEPDKSASRYTFRSPEGLVLGPIKLRTVAVLVREKRITGREEVAKDGEEFKSLREFPELVEFFPELSAKPEAVIAETRIAIDEQTETPTRPPAPPPSVPEPKVYHIKFNGTREFGPVKKSTVLDLIECKFLSGKDLISQDRETWSLLQEVEEFQKLVPPATEEEVVEELVETVEE